MLFGLPAEDAPCISAKSGLNVEQVLERIITDFPPPNGDENSSLQALIFDSFYDNYKGAVSHVRIKNGKVKEGDEILFMATNKRFVVTEVGYFGAGRYIPCKELSAGEVRIYCCKCEKCNRCACWRYNYKCIKTS